MKKNIKKISIPLFVFIIGLLLINISSAGAITQETDYVSINSRANLQVGNLLFTDIEFYNSNDIFGLAGNVTNILDNSIHYFTYINYYDANYNPLGAQFSFQDNAISGTSNFSFLLQGWLLEGHNVDEIYYYTLLVQIDDEHPYQDYYDLFNNNDYYDYTIDKYNVDIVVNENNTFDITETITAYFNVEKHGIYRTIPLKNKIIRLDGTTSTNRAQVTNVSVDNKYKTYRESGNYIIKIGSASRTLTGEQTYVIKYTYNIGKDPLKESDELYYNIIGNEWDTTIDNITFSITMPKEFDSSKIGFSSGLKGSTANDNIKYSVVGNTITGNYEGTLQPGEGLTVRCELQEGYFVGAGLDINPLSYILFLIPIIFLAISIHLWYKFGRDDQVIETVEFYPPEGFNSLEVGHSYKGKAENKDVTSLLIYLANKGYIKIAEIEEKKLLSKSKGFKIIKIKDYDGNNDNEKMFLEGLFKKRPTFTSIFSKNTKDTTEIINEVTSSDLYNNFYVTMSNILSNVNNKENKYKLFEKSASTKSKYIILMMIVSYCLITIPAVISFDAPEILVVPLLFPTFGFLGLFGMLNSSSVGSKLVGIFICIMFVGMPWGFIVLPSLLIDLIYLIGNVLGMLCIVGMLICLKYLPKRTSYGNEMLGKLRGFKNFLETAEKDKLETMVLENPTYFYDILPYTYVLGVSDKWIKKFETISLKAPDWYDSPNTFDIASFGSFMNSTMSSAENSMSSSSSSDSGGGSSGGGSGGGGGGSW